MAYVPDTLKFYLSDNDDVIADIINAAAVSPSSVAADKNNVKKIPKDLHIRVLNYLNEMQVMVDDDFPYGPQTWIIFRECNNMCYIIMPVAAQESQRIDIDVCAYSALAAVLHAYGATENKTFSGIAVIYVYFGADDWAPNCMMPMMERKIIKPCATDYQFKSSLGEIFQAIKNDSLKELSKTTKNPWIKIISENI